MCFVLVFFMHCIEYCIALYCVLYLVFEVPACTVTNTDLYIVYTSNITKFRQVEW